MTFTCSGKKTFTLIEMLVVISIIAILAALLMPALQSAIDAAHTTSCLSNQKQSGFAQQQYADEWTWMNVKWYWAGRFGDTFWSAFVDGSVTGGTEYATHEVMCCPANEFYSQDTNSTNINRGVYGIYYPEYNTNTETTNRGFDRWYRNSNTTIPGGIRSLCYFLPMHVGSPSKTMMLTDTISNASLAQLNGHMLPHFQGDRQSRWTTRTHLIHNEMAATVFFDGHAAVLSPFQMREDTETQVKHFFSRDRVELDIP